MTLTRLVLAWLPVAVWFVVAPPIGYRVDVVVGPRYFVWAYDRWTVTGRLLEAVVVTLLGSLWFDSLGSGGWWRTRFGGPSDNATSSSASWTRPVTSSPGPSSPGDSPERSKPVRF